MQELPQALQGDELAPHAAPGRRTLLHDAPSATLDSNTRETDTDASQAKAYNNNIFFNVQRDFLAQSGDPTNTGKGGESAYQ